MGGAACPGRNYCTSMQWGKPFMEVHPAHGTKARATFLDWKRPQKGYSINISITWFELWGPWDRQKSPGGGPKYSRSEPRKRNSSVS